MEIVTKKLAVPAENTPLESIIRLRDKPQFRDSMYQLRRWQTQIVDQLLQRQGDPTKILRTAEEDLKRCIKKYDEAMTEAKIAKIETVVLSILAIGATLATGSGPAIAALAGLAQPLFSFRKLMKPCWKEISDNQYAFAGVIYAASGLR